MKQLIFVAVISLFGASCGSPTSNTVMNSAAANSNNTNSSAHNSNTPRHAPPSEPSANTAQTSDGKGPHTVKFAHGATSASYSGSFAGYDYVDYVLDAKQGQKLSAEFTQNDNNHAIMTIMRSDLKIADDSAETDKWSGQLPADGSYTIRVGQMRNDARRGNTPVKFTLKISVN